MKRLLIGFDGSPAASASMEDLVHACIPLPVEALVLSVADVWLPPEESMGGTATPRPSESPSTTGNDRGFGQFDTDPYVKARAVLESSRTTADEGAQKLVRLFPDWRVAAEAMADSPGWGLVERARTWKADLIVVGAHSHTRLERFFFGSAASTVVMQAPCSVRISRPRKHLTRRPMRLVLAVDGSPESAQAARETASRTWPSDTEVRVVTVVDPKLEAGIARSRSVAPEWLQEHFRGANELLSAMTLELAERLKTKGYPAEPRIFEGDPKKVLLREAETWEADCIFLGARGLDHAGRWMLGSVASALASRAHCSVEIIRPC